MLSHSDYERAERLVEVVQDVVDLSRETGIRGHVVAELLRHMTAAEVAEAVREHGDAPAVVAHLERLSPGVVEAAGEVHLPETARA